MRRNSLNVHCRLGFATGWATHPTCCAAIVPTSTQKVEKGLRTRCGATAKACRRVRRPGTTFLRSILRTLFASTSVPSLMGHCTLFNRSLYPLQSVAVGSGICKKFRPRSPCRRKILHLPLHFALMGSRSGICKKFRPRSPARRKILHPPLHFACMGSRSGICKKFRLRIPSRRKILHPPLHFACMVLSSGICKKFRPRSPCRRKILHPPLHFACMGSRSGICKKFRPRSPCRHLPLRFAGMVSRPRNLSRRKILHPPLHFAP